MENALYVTRTERFSEKEGERYGVPNIAIVITDVLPQKIDYYTHSEASILKQTSTVLAISITQYVDKEWLKELSSLPQKENEQYFTAANFTGLGETFKKALLSETCRAPLRKNINKRSKRASLNEFPHRGRLIFGMHYLEVH